MELGLQGKVALVTGASRGLGAAIALELAREGAHVCLAARDSGKLDEMAAKISAIGGRAAIYAGDLRQQTALEAALAQAQALREQRVLIIDQLRNPVLAPHPRVEIVVPEVPSDPNNDPI